MSFKENQTEEEFEPTTPYNFDEKAHEMEESDRLQRELWRWHLKLNHLSFPRIRYMELQGRLPKRLNSKDVPFCPTCAYSRATRKPWRYKNGQSKLKETTEPGQCVSVDTFEFNSRVCCAGQRNTN